MAELTTPVDLCDPVGSGRLNPAAIGWSRRPIHTCSLRGAWPRKKRWNYWAFTTPTHLFSVTVANIDYAGLAFLYVADFEAKTLEEETILVPLALGCDLPDRVDADVRFDRSGLSITMLQDETPARHSVAFEVDMPGFAGRGLRADLVVRYPAEHDTLNVVIPWSERRFQFTAKHNTLPVEGSVRLGAGRGAGSQRICFEGPNAFACLDYGRGIWPYRCVWNWGAASGRQGERIVGLNLGGRWTDGTGATENAVCIDGVLRKIDDDLAWDYDPKDWMKPWRIYSPDRRTVDLELTPILERVATTRAVVVRSEVHQMFGHYRGQVLDSEGRSVEIDGLVGWAEDHHAAW